MDTRITFNRNGRPDVLQVQQFDRAKPGVGEVWLEQEAIGVNYLDVTQRNGAVPIPLPSGIGLEGAGRVVAIGPEVDEVAVGDRVAYALGPTGAYASGRLYPAERLIKLPDQISFEEAAAIFFKGLTAQYLIKSTYRVEPGTVVLLYGVAGAVGRILAPWARRWGATVIGVVSRPESLDTAKAAGCAAVLIWGRDNLPAGIRAATGGRKADVVYDAIGRKTFDVSLDCLAPRGTMVSFGASSGSPDPVAVETLNKKGSIYLTRPGLGAHITDVSEYRERARDVLEAVASGIIKPHIWKAYALRDAARAHEDLEAGVSRGAIVLTPRSG
jgi:NADPH2:quinone reductase